MMFIAALAILFFFVTSVNAAEQPDTVIKSISTRYVINKDTSINVEETLTYHLNKPAKELTIYLPASATDFSGKNTWKGEISDIKVTQKSGKTNPFTKGFDIGKGDFVIIKADSGGYSNDVSFMIFYRVGKQIVHENNKGRLVWDIIGPNRNMPVMSVDAVVSFADGTILNADCRAGSEKLDNRFCRAEYDPHEARFLSTKALESGETFRYAIDLADQELVYPSAAEKFSLGLMRNKWLIMGSGTGVIVLFFIGRRMMAGRKISIKFRKRE